MLLPCVEVETAPVARAAVIWLHGLGADGHDFEPIVPELELPADLGLRFVFPHAPQMPVTINGGYVMRAWYDICHPSIDQRPDEAGIRQSMQAVGALVDQQIERGIPAANIVLAGFSQGGVIALHTALRYPQTLAGVMALSTYLPLPDSLDSESQQSGLPVFLAHGRWDELVPLALSQQAGGKLESLGCDVTSRVYDMAHTVCAAEIRDMGAWLSARLTQML